VPLIFIFTLAAATGEQKQAVSFVRKSAKLAEFQHAKENMTFAFVFFLDLKFVFRWDSQIMKRLYLRQVLR
jgi:hypothetical protein